MYLFLERQKESPELAAGHLRLIEDALAVVRGFGLDPFRGLARQEVRAMEREVRWTYALPRELVKLHRGLSRSLEGLRPPLVANGNNVRTDIVGSVPYSTLERGHLDGVAVRDAPEQGEPQALHVRRDARSRAQDRRHRRGTGIDAVAAADADLAASEGDVERIRLLHPRSRRAAGYGWRSSSSLRSCARLRQ
jgi:hypothetical protein